VSDAPQAIPADVVLSTSEPFWKVRVADGVVLLTGLHAQRRLAVQRNEPLFDGRAVTARDDTGTLELRVTERLCIDGVSGKQFAYTGRLVVDGGVAVIGCGAPLPATAAERF